MTDHAYTHPLFEFMSGRGRHHGRHRGGPGGGPPFGFPFGGPRGFRRGPGVKRGDVRDALLLLLAEEPRNGYQLMQEIESRSDGVWRPSPGSVYPALSQLEDEGLVRAEEGSPGKVFALTDAGRKHVDERDEDGRPRDASRQLHTPSFTSHSPLSSPPPAAGRGEGDPTRTPARALRILAEDEPRGPGSTSWSSSSSSSSSSSPSSVSSRRRRGGSSPGSARGARRAGPRRPARRRRSGPSRRPRTPPC